MRRAWHIAVKELLQTRRDRLAALFSVVLPVVFTVFLGLLIGGFGSTDAFPLAVADVDGSPASRQLLEALADEPLLDITPVAEEDVEQAVLDQEVAAALIIPRSYGQTLGDGRQATLSFVRVETSTSAQSVYQAVQTAVGRLNAQTLATEAAVDRLGVALGETAAASLLSAAENRVAESLASPAIAVALVDAQTAGARQLGGFEQASTGSLVNWVLFGLLTVATGMAWERRQGLLRRLVTTGTGGVQIIGGKMLGMIILTFSQQLFLILLGRFAFGVDYLSSPLALVMVMLTLSFLAASLALLIASVFRSEQAVVATTVISALLLAALAGAWFPLEITSAGFSRVAHFLPTAWVMDCLHGIVLGDWGPADVLRPLGIVWIWVVAFFGLAVWRFRAE